MKEGIAERNKKGRKRGDMQLDLRLHLSASFVSFGYQSHLEGL
jgi:hypothetical protein